ncbi:response regulator [Frigidibacter sp. SD6-1]|uniref:response regulator n=1 Tax=Frigidibacter sp. SD6-1 TaxID=3032581 RepID=UPI0024DF71D5|nr:response regulator [Frigidibacter sp. SD6-1]
MADDLTELLVTQAPQPGRPLWGLTVLVVEDSRFACEAMRLLCLRSGARIRRADCLGSARRHLMTYRPTVVIVDPGLPDGSGLDLIAELAAARPRIPAILGASGDPGLEAEARARGADGFLTKPIESLAAFQRAILAALPAVGGARPQIQPGDRIEPDRMALRDDLLHAADILDHAPDDGRLDYLSRFLVGVARIAHDGALADAAEAMAGDHDHAPGELSALVRDRLAAGSSF